MAGTIDIDGQRLDAGEGARNDAQAELRIAGVAAADFLLFDLRVG